MSTPLNLTFAAVVAVALSVSACGREDKPRSPKPKTPAANDMTRTSKSLRPATPSSGAGRDIHFTGAPAK